MAIFCNLDRRTLYSDPNSNGGGGGGRCDDDDDNSDDVDDDIETFLPAADVGVCGPTLDFTANLSVLLCSGFLSALRGLFLFLSRGGMGLLLLVRVLLVGVGLE